MLSNDRAHAALRRYRVRTLAVLTAVALAAGGLAAANLLQAPRVIAVEYRAEALTSSDGARITVTLSEAVGAVRDGDVTAAVPLAARSDGATITLTVHEALDYGTSLRIQILVTSAATGVRGTVEALVGAADARVSTLVRDDRGDRIISDWLVRGGGPTEVPLGRAVQEYATLPDRVFAITAAGDPGSGSVEFGAFVGGREQYTPVIARTDAVLTQLHAEPQVGYVGVVADGLRVGGRTLARELLLFDGRAESGAPATVSGPDGAPIAVAAWGFVPGTAAVVVRGTDGTLWEADPVLGVGAEPIDRADPRAAVLRDGAVVEVSGGSIARTPTGAGLVRTVGGRTAPFFTPPGAGSRIGAVCASPNRRVIAVEVISAEGVPDGRAVSPGYSHTTTVFLDVRTAAQLRSVIGFAPSWC